MTASLKIVIATLLFSTSSLLHAISVEYEVLNQTGNHYELEYTVTNDDVAAGLEVFDIFFEYGLYENINASVSPAGWDPFFLDPEEFFGTTYDGFVDYYSYDIPLALGDTFSGFVIEFDWLGTGDLTGQYFEAYDSLTFDLISDGLVSSAISDVTPVPLPGSLWLMALGFGVASLLRKKVF